MTKTGRLLLSSAAAGGPRAVEIADRAGWT